MKLIRITFLFTLIISFSSFTTSAHKYYMSVTDIEYVPQKKSLQIVSRIFVDDLEKLLQTRYDDSAQLIKGQNNPENNEYIKKYFQDKFEIIIKNKQLSLNFIGKRYEDDMIICYFEAVNVENFKSITISNLVLTDLFEDQKNLVHVKKDERTESIMLIKDKPKDTIKF
ncbi:hypothetical protein SAMN04488096_101242 [Mesonia phycicola]|uniref:Peptidase E n=1 Tax=Mesonia phycicola TaxID=579105 RepID=A0A1M6AFH3_9FLAO|nr:DUF6702 family protein [Mesonia phycicola]SHI35161.1 hypothetical protein SAMN04488096_101242 [Mesonia phycicola]